LVINIQSQLLK